MPPETGPSSPDKLSIVVFSGSFEKVHYALAMASAAVAVNRPATLFFTMEAIHGVAKTAPGERRGWRALTTEGAEDAEARDRLFAERGAAAYEELFEACTALGVRFMVCEMGLRAIGLSAAELRDDVTVTEGGIVSFLNDASATGAMLFI